MRASLRRFWVRLQLRIVALETDLAERAERDIPRRLEELAGREIALRTRLGTLAAPRRPAPHLRISL